VEALKHVFDGQVLIYTVLALIPNLFLILWAMARLSREVQMLKSKMSMVESDLDLLDQNVSSLSAELQPVRKAREGNIPPPAGKSR